MFVLAKDIAVSGGIIPKGTQLSDVYEVADHIAAMARFDGKRIKLRLAVSDIEIGKQ